MIEYSAPYPTLGAFIRHAYAETRKPWGGTTFQWSSYRTVLDGSDAYAVSVKPEGQHSVAVARDADYATFEAAFMHAATVFGGSYIGVFRDEDLDGEIHFDPVEVVATTAEVDEIAKTHPVVGGAYHFATGNGYWPQNSPVAA